MAAADETGDEARPQTEDTAVPADPRPSEALIDDLTDIEENPFAGLLAEAQKPDGKAQGSAVIESQPPQPASQRRIATELIRTDGDPDPVKIGPYELQRELGSGGMAVVHEAKQPALGRLVAVKSLRPEYIHDPQIQARFEREATSLGTLQHGNIVHVYDYLKNDNNAHIVMEHVDGIDLFDLLVEVEQLPAEIAALIGLQIALGLEYAHYRGIVHRDVKPSNVLVSRRGEVKIMDFGIARDEVKSELTQVGLAVGTPAYMSPEQIRGDRIDFRTDVFAFGILLYEMLSGAKPWPEEQGRSVTVQVLDEEPVPLVSRVPSAPPELIEIVHRCLNKDPGQRFASTHALRRALENFVSRRVTDDPRGRLVAFLAHRGLVRSAEARAFAPRELLEDPDVQRRDAGVMPPPQAALLKPVGFSVLVGAIAVLLFTLIGLKVPMGQPLPSSPPQITVGESVPLAHLEKEVERRLRLERGDSKTNNTKPDAAAVAPAKGFLKVVITPWARVLVDGRHYDDTPFAEPIALPAGEHRIGLRNTYYESVDRIVRIEAGKTKLLKLALVPRGQPADAP